MKKALGKNINVDLSDALNNHLDNARESALKLNQQVIDLKSELIAERDAHQCTKNVLIDVVARLKSGTDANVLVADIEQYFKDLGHTE